jgi:hypothetical protein
MPAGGIVGPPIAGGIVGPPVTGMLGGIPGATGSPVGRSFGGRSGEHPAAASNAPSARQDPVAIRCIVAPPVMRGPGAI